MIYGQDVIDDLYQHFEVIRPTLESRYPFVFGMGFQVRRLELTGQCILTRTTWKIAFEPKPTLGYETSEIFRIVTDAKGYVCPALYPLTTEDNAPAYVKDVVFDLYHETRPESELVKTIATMMEDVLTYYPRAMQTAGTHNFCDSCPKQLSCLEKIANGSELS